MRAPPLLLAALLLAAACGPGTPPSKPPSNPSTLDADGDGVSAAQDCDDHDLTRSQRLPGYVDADGDGVGDGPLQQVCSGAALPQGFAKSAGDCAPYLASQWRLQELYVDVDRDGFTRGAAQTLCVGSTVPQGFALTAKVEDCDDADARAWRTVQGYADVDGDGRGAGSLQQRCVGAAVPVDLAAAADDCAPLDPWRYALLPYAYRDADGDGATVAQAGEVCADYALPQGYANVAGREDCDDTNPSFFERTQAYADADGDGVGGGEARLVCGGSTLPAGFTFSGNDCAAEDASRWAQVDFPRRDADLDGRSVPLEPAASFCVGSADPQGYARSSYGWPDDCDDAEPARWQQLDYAYRDADGDGASVPEQGSVCSGSALPAGYAQQQARADCDDSDAALSLSLSGYADADADGFGAGEAQTFCTAGKLPTGYVAQAGDCAAEDAARWRNVTPRYIDEDGDGFTRAQVAPAPQCIGTAADAPWQLVANGNDCDDQDAAAFRWRVLYPDADGDGVGAEPRTLSCLGLGLPPAGLAVGGWDSDDADAAVQESAEDALLTELLLGL